MADNRWLRSYSLTCLLLVLRRSESPKPTCGPTYLHTLSLLLHLKRSTADVRGDYSYTSAALSFAREM